MKTNTKNLGMFTAAAMLLSLAGCAGGTQTATTTTAATAAAETTTTAAETTTTAAETTTTAAETTTTTAAETTTTAVETATTAETTADGEAVKVAALKGPTAMGMVKLMDDTEGSGEYDFSIYAAPDELTPLIIQGKVDIACVPANLASVLYNKTEGGIEVMAVNTLGVLYIVENGESVASFEDLRGKTIYASGKGATPEFALNYLLTQNGIDPETDVNIEWKSEHAECLTALLSDENGVAMLPQPFVTTAMTKNESIRVALDMTEEWDSLDNGSSLLTGVVIGSREFIESSPEAAAGFMEAYSASVGYVNENIDEAAELIEKYDIVPAAVAKKALPACNIVCVTGEDMKNRLSGYLGVLFDQLPSSVGGALPADDFYYIIG